MICIPIGGKTIAQVFKRIEESALLADVLELRMDMIGDGDLPMLVGKIRSSIHPVKILVTPARKWLLPQARRPSEPAAGEVSARAVELGVDFVDVELRDEETPKEELLGLIRERGNRTKLICSCHDFRRTPSVQALRGLFHECIRTGAHAAKIVTWARCPEDNLKALGLIPYARKTGREIIAFCMGSEGKMSRVMAPLLGSMMSFATLRRGAESAPGQLTVSEMRLIWERLGHGR